MSINKYIAKYGTYSPDELADLFSNVDMNHTRSVACLMYLNAKAAENILKKRGLYDEFLQCRAQTIQKYQQQDQQPNLKNLTTKVPCEYFDTDEHCHDSDGHCIPFIANCTEHAAICIDDCHCMCSCQETL